jgi:lycopene beta-cyclase
MHYDYIVTGGGCAGLSLLIRMIRAKELKGKKILLIDKEIKKENDRTWCFWETEPGLFESIVHKSWDQLFFFGQEFEQLLKIAPYRYKMIRGIDFYNFAHAEIGKENRVDVELGSITQQISGKEKAEVEVNGKRFSADYIFNSILFDKPDLQKYYSLQQHFKGWFIKTDKKSFRESLATLMDFRIDQKHGTTFVYVLPFDEHHALVEYTLFTRDLLTSHEYDDALTNYIRDFLKLEQYLVEEEEFGVIPMTNYPFPAHQGRIIHMGTAGGQTKASSGYTFQFIQKHAQKIVDSLAQNGTPYLTKSLAAKRYSFYDSTLLHILDKRKLEGKSVFTDLFKKGDPQTVLKFLDNETTISEDLSIMYRLPKMTFARAAWQEIMK